MYSEGVASLSILLRSFFSVGFGISVPVSMRDVRR